MLGDEITKAVSGSQALCAPPPDGNPSDHVLQLQLNSHWAKLNDCNAYIQVTYHRLKFAPWGLLPNPVRHTLDGECIGESTIESRLQLEVWCRNGLLLISNGTFGWKAPFWFALFMEVVGNLFDHSGGIVGC